MQSMRYQDIEGAVRASVKGDFPPQDIRAGRYIRVKSIGGEYYPFRACFIGKLMKVEQPGIVGWVCAFVHEADREAANKAAGYGSGKRTYLLTELKAKVL